MPGEKRRFSLITWTARKLVMTVAFLCSIGGVPGQLRLAPSLTPAHPNRTKLGKFAVDCKCELSARRSWRLYTFRTQTLAPNIAINCKWRAGPQDGGRWQDLQLTANCRSSGTCPETHPGTGSSARVPP